MVRRSAILALFFGVFVATPGLGNAQGREPLSQPSAVPVDLAMALMSAGGFGVAGDPQILVGAIPEWASARMKFPEAAHVLGSAFLGSTIVAVIAMPTASDSVVEQIARELQHAGWRPAPYQVSGGFRPARIEARPQSRATLCEGNQTLTVWRTRQQAAQSTLLMRLSSTTTGYSPCNPPRMPDDPDGPRLNAPILFNPENATEARMPDCSPRLNFGPGSGTGTRIRTAMSPAEVLEHYGRQLQDSGWTSTSTAPAEVARTWTRADSTGQVNTLQLTVRTWLENATCRSVDLMIHRARRP